MGKMTSKKSYINIFEATDSRSYLAERLRQMGRGSKNRLAKFLPVHNTYITHVLGAQAQLSLEQADRCNLFLGHEESESRYFLLLVSRDRAGSERLRAHYNQDLDDLKNAHLELSQRLEFEKSLSLEDQLRYYESWLPSAVHMSLTVPDLRSADALSRRFHLPVERIHQALKTLLSLGLVRKEGLAFLPTSKTLHAGRGSPMLKQHHANWRLRAIESVDREQKSDLHYTSVVSLSRDDVLRVREALVQAVENVRGVVASSKEEEVYCYSLDLFRVE